MPRIQVAGWWPRALLVAAALASCRQAPAPASGPLAPDFSLKDPAGRVVRLSDFRGKVVLLDFWATYCGPCEESIPALDRLYRGHKAAGLEVVGVSEDSFPDAVPPYVAEHRMTYTVLLDPDQSAREPYKLRGLPQAFLIDREGRIAGQWFGWDPRVHAGIEEDVKKLLAAK